MTKKVNANKKKDAWSRLQSELLYGDMNAYYWMHYYTVDPSLEMVIEGEYPYCRYMSYTAYGVSNKLVTGAVDQRITPDPGSANPFMPGAGWNTGGRKYTIVIRFTPPPANTDFFVPGAGNNVIYVGSLPNGEANTGGFLAYRLYLPSRGRSMTGGVNLPKVYYRRVQDGGKVKVELPFALNFNKLYPILEQNTESDDNHLLWHRSSGDIKYAGNPDTVYLEAKINTDPSKLLLIRWKAPTFPDTFNNKGITGKEDMRYWSMSFCSRRGGSNLYTISDYQAITGEDGYINLAVSFGVPRPAHMTPENGYTWVDLKNKSVSVLLYRNMAVSPDFPYTAAKEPGGITITDQLGEHLPVGKYIPVAKNEQT